MTWDAVEHAASYEVAYETTSVLLDRDNHVQGVAFDWTQTSWTFQHDAAEAMTITVTVTPAYEDGNGDTRLLSSLGGTATIDVGPPETGVDDGDGGTGGEDSRAGGPPPASSCVDDAQWKTVKGYYESNSGKGPNYGANWYRVLIAYRRERTDKALPDWTGRRRTAPGDTGASRWTARWTSRCCRWSCRGPATQRSPATPGAEWRTRSRGDVAVGPGSARGPTPPRRRRGRHSVPEAALRASPHFSSGAAMIGEDFGPCVPTGVRVLATERRKSHRLRCAVSYG